MNLFQKILPTIGVILLLATIIGSVSHFFIFRYFIHHTADSQLMAHKESLEETIRSQALKPPYTNVFKLHTASGIPVKDPSIHPAIRFSDTIMVSPKVHKSMVYRQVTFPVTAEGESYLITIRHATIETEDLIFAISSAIIFLCLLLLLLSYILGRSLSRNIWKPVGKNMEVLTNYGTRNGKKIKLKTIGVREFDEVNNVIEMFAKKLNENYENSKNFAEDASHEMQTPLAIIKSKLDLLLQDHSIQNEEQYKHIVSISRAVMRLSKINSSLLMISKIKNHKYDKKTKVSITQVINNYLSDLEELISVKGIRLKCNIPEFICEMDHYLADALISNLINNSIRHNIQNGYIDIRLSDGLLSVTNSCPNVKDYKNINLFDRHVHRGDSADSTGLGLDIVRSICEESGFEVKYYYPDRNIFRIEILFRMG